MNLITKRLVFLSTVLAMSLNASGCAVTGGSKEPIVQSFEPGKSFAYNIAALAQINTPKGGKPHIEDVELSSDQIKSLDSSVDLFGVGLGVSMLRFPSSIGSSGMNSLMAVDLILGSLSGPPILTMNRHAALAWFPADQASSPKDAMDKMHAIRLDGIKRSLDERGMEYRISKNDLNYRVMPWVPAMHYAEILIDEFGDMCTKEAPCRIEVATRMPRVNKVIAPKELTGQPFPAYLFSAGELDKTSVILMHLNIKRDDADGYYYGTARDYENITWLSKNQPDWAVFYISQPTQQALAQLNNGSAYLVNPFPFMAHKGETKLFVIKK